MGKQVELETLYGEIHACSLARQCPGIEPNLRAREFDAQACHAKLALMAQAPSRRGVRRSGIHWVGGDGELLSHGGTFLDPYLKTVGYSVDPADTQRQRPYTTNVLQCWTGRGRSGDRRPRKDELDRCRHWWVAELQIIHPAVLVLLGAIASQACGYPCGYDASKQGVTMPLDDVSVRVFALPHPSDRRDNSDLYADVFSQIGQVLGA